MHTEPNAVVIVGHIESVQICTGGVRKYRSLQVVVHGMMNCREYSRGVHLVYNTLRDHPVRYSKWSHSLSELFRSKFGELYRYVQKVYENAFAADCCTW